MSEQVQICASLSLTPSLSFRKTYTSIRCYFHVPQSCLLPPLLPLSLPHTSMSTLSLMHTYSLSLTHTSIGLWHPLNAVSVLCDIHNGYTWDLSDPPLEVSVTRSHNVALVLQGHFNYSCETIGATVM